MTGKFTRYAAEATVFVAGLCLLFVLITGEPGALGDSVQTRLSGSLARLISVTMLVGIAGIFLLERFLPARPEQRGLTPPVAIDMAYMFLLFPATAGAILFVLSPLRSALDSNFSWLVLDSTRDWPILLQASLGFIFSDFVSWLNHVLKHKVPFLWRFHIIHHSQTRLNMFTPDRMHPIETFFDRLVNVLPLYFIFPNFTAEADKVLLFILFFSWYTKLQHSNVRLNMGPLRYLLVTPQSHRIHHSTEPRHFNSNYGNIFCWDRLVGFQCSDDTTYPTTGINDLRFPQPKRWAISDLCSNLLGQLAYPFDRDAVRKASEGSPHDTIAAAPGGPAS